MGPLRTLPATSRARLWNRPQIQFQQESELETVSQVEIPKQDRGELVASFYRSITSPPITTPSEVTLIDPTRDPEPSKSICPICHLPLPSSTKSRRSHNCTTAHLAKVVDSRPPPLNPLHIGRSSYGYKVLLLQGWNDKDRYGIGAEDNKGRREPVKASRVKNDTVGLGIKDKKVEEAVKEKKSIEGGKEIRARYEKEKRLRKEWMDYMHS
jgi:hypothetical protein